jgi:hypothetical protein
MNSDFASGWGACEMALWAQLWLRTWDSARRSARLPKSVIGLEICGEFKKSDRQGFALRPAFTRPAKPPSSSDEITHNEMIAAE